MVFVFERSLIGTVLGKYEKRKHIDKNNNVLQWSHCCILKITMKRITAEWPKEPRTDTARKTALVYASMLTITVTAQLFSFERFMPLIESFGLPWGRALAILLVVGSVLALPFLLRMKVSVGLRWLSMICGWVVAVIWLFLSIWINSVDIVIYNSGILGASVSVLPGWWLVFVAIGFGILAVWSAWGLWPGRRISLETTSK